MPKAIKEKKRLHAPAVDFVPIKQEPQSDYDIHLKNLETIKTQLPPIEIPKHEEEVEEVKEKEESEQTKQPKLTKEQKRKQRHDRLLQKLNHTALETQKQKEKIQPKKPEKKTQSAAPLGLITKDLLSTLLEVEAQEEEERERKRGDEKVKAQHFTDKERQDLLKKEVQQFTSVIDHPVFQANPLATIKEHLTNSIALQKAKDNRAITFRNNKNKEEKKKKEKKPLTQQLNEKRKGGKPEKSTAASKLKKNIQGIQKVKKLKKK